LKTAAKVGRLIASMIAGPFMIVLIKIIAILRFSNIAIIFGELVVKQD
jgi:hypothetical protein